MAKTKFNKTRFVRQHAVRIGTMTPQAITVFNHLLTAGEITQRQALLDHSVQSLTRRITEIRDAGFPIDGVWKKNPITGQRYMRYSFDRTASAA